MSTELALKRKSLLLFRRGWENRWLQLREIQEHHFQPRDPYLHGFKRGSGWLHRRTQTEKFPDLASCFLVNSYDGTTCHFLSTRRCPTKMPRTF
jgi:hypothetical protein